METKFKIMLAAFLSICVIISWFIGYFIFRAAFAWRVILFTLALAMILQINKTLCARIIFRKILASGFNFFTMVIAYALLITVFYATVNIYIYLFTDLL